MNKLDSNTKIERETLITQKEKMYLLFEKMKKLKMFKQIENPVQWQKELRNEWE